MSMNYRALELHGSSIWDHRKIGQALDTAVAYGMTTLVLHESDLTTEFIFPSAYFSPTAPWAGAPSRRGENALFNNRVYLNDILRRAERKGIEIWVEVKELTFPDELIELYPALFRDGTVCPSDPLWNDFLKAKYRDLVSWYPGIRGVIVSAGSPEGRAALSQKKCRCERCAAGELSAWYRSIIEAMYEILSPAGVKLAVREFSYTAAHQDAISRAVAALPEDVIYCLKVTPHDFYPTFPDNSLIAGVSGRPKWIEYDTMGQYYGWGVVPCLTAGDIRERFTHAADNGVEGALLRVEWERVNDWWSLESPNRMNLYAAARGATGIFLNTSELAGNWLEEEGIPASSGERELFEAFLDDSWHILRQALYMNDFVLNDSSMFPMSIERAWWSMEKKHSLVEWFPERKEDLELNEEKVYRYITEKREANRLAAEWHGHLTKNGSSGRFSQSGSTGRLSAMLENMTAVLERYTEGFLRVGSVCMLSGWIDRAAEDVPQTAFSELSSALDSLTLYTSELRSWLDASHFRHQYRLLFNADRAEAVCEGGRARLAGGKAL